MAGCMSWYIFTCLAICPSFTSLSHAKTQLLELSEYYLPSPLPLYGRIFHISIFVFIEKSAVPFVLVAVIAKEPFNYLDIFVLFQIVRSLTYLVGILKLLVKLHCYIEIESTSCCMHTRCQCIIHRLYCVILILIVIYIYIYIYIFLSEVFVHVFHLIVVFSYLFLLTPYRCNQ